MTVREGWAFSADLISLSSVSALPCTEITYAAGWKLAIWDCISLGMVIGDYASLAASARSGTPSPFHSTIIFQRANTNEMRPTGNEFNSETLFEIEAQTLSI